MAKQEAVCITNNRKTFTEGNIYTIHQQKSGDYVIDDNRNVWALNPTHDGTRYAVAGGNKRMTTTFQNAAPKRQKAKAIAAVALVVVATLALYFITK